MSKMIPALGCMPDHLDFSQSTLLVENNIPPLSTVTNGGPSVLMTIVIKTLGVDNI